ncbi:uncharacterized protein LOC106152847 [Lingula anatina]|uniref:Uncharacterized protein LOC106152847 n=1 Tax=Lingula anatina TaxID=7574 RepID=A0A1S3H7T2_LINAN|nr:uncharacterized protein LOC106152847 [Lingula anatina]|eukprot:XP_013382037.1 uncharacterized protein LOC106152847 [Lingula anatina]
MATTIESYTGSDQENFFRLCILIVDYALKVVQHVLQEELESKYPNLFDPSTGLLFKVLSDTTVKTILFGLPRNVFNKQQKDQLYPVGNPSKTVTVGDLDITLTVLLLRNITKLVTGSNAWDNPSDSDKSKEAEIGRVKRYRNVDYAHITKAAISLDVFREKFSGLKSSLLALSGRYSGEEYDAILHRPLDTGLLKEYQDVMNKLYNNDKEVKEWMMENRDMLNKIDLRTIDIQEKVQVLYDRNQDRSERRISPGSRSRSSSQSDSDDSPVPSTSTSGQKSGRHHKQRVKSGKM